MKLFTKNSVNRWTIDMLYSRYIIIIIFYDGIMYLMMTDEYARMQICGSIDYSALRIPDA